MKNFRKWTLAIGRVAAAASFATGGIAQELELLNYSLEDLSQCIVEDNSASLTLTTLRETPASVTVITHRQLLASGARSLDEALEIFVPSFATMLKVHGTQMGMRGIISDRNNKILLLLNGRNMNVKASDGGAVTERWADTLDDIAKITVISGPGSAVYGPGAIAGVINIETFDGTTFEGTETHVRAGAGESFVSAQLRHGRRFDDGSALFLYYGVEQASGADDATAPHKVAFDMTIKRPDFGTVIDIEANRNFPFETPPAGASFHANPRHKLHLQYDDGGLTLWARYTQSGQAVPTMQNLFQFNYHKYGYSYPDIFQDTGNRQKQWTLYGQYTTTLAPNLTMEASASLMRSDMEIWTLNDPDRGKAWHEEDGLLDARFHYTPSASHAFAVGLSYDVTRFTDRRKLLTIFPIEDGEDPKNLRWYSQMGSIYGEYQGKWGDRTTLFAGFRLDKHRFSPWMASPRLAWVHLPTDDDTLKLLYNHSVRHSDDADLYKIHALTSGDGDVEKIDHFEAIYSHDFKEAGEVELSLYYNIHDVVAFNQHSLLQEYLGRLRFYGVEMQYRYDTDAFHFQLSHSYTKEIDFDLTDPNVAFQNISASPYGYGDDLANWHDHITKLYLEWRGDDVISVSGSLRVYWGMPGAIDLADYNMQERDGNLLLPLYSDGTRAFGTSAFLDLGFRYRLNQHTELSLHGYNLLGIFDEDLNKRNFFQRTSHYLDMAPSVAVGLRYRF
jgi:iron complex outermembrane receptor protein